jgi:hypothetical protein
MEKVNQKLLSVVGAGPKTGLVVCHTERKNHSLLNVVVPFFGVGCKKLFSRQPECFKILKYFSLRPSSIVWTKSSKKE